MPGEVQEAPPGSRAISGFSEVAVGRRAERELGNATEVAISEVSKRVWKWRLSILYHWNIVQWLKSPGV